MITYFKSLSDTSQPFYRSVDYAIERIKNGNSKDLCEAIRSHPDDKPKRNEIKKKLPAICFSGEFLKREKKSIQKHSGFICIDFDGFADEWSMTDYRDTLCLDEYSYAVFTSPSGDGIKVLVKVPPIIENHTNYFLSLQKYYNVPEFDTSTKDISRVCYESYDPDVQVNKESKLWDKILVEEHQVFEKKTSRSTIVLDNDNEVIRRLNIWWNKEFGMVAGAKNNNLFILASALNEFGIPEADARSVMLSYDEGGKEKEILTLLRSAYKNEASHNTKFYEDTTKIDAIKTMAKSGVPTVELVKLNSQVPHDVVESIASEEDDAPGVFWSKNSKGAITHINHLYKEYLESMGYNKFYIEGGSAFVFVQINNNIISDASDDTIKDVVLKALHSLEDKSIYNYFADKTKLFKEDHLSFLNAIKPSIMTDTVDTAHLYFKNCVVRVTKDKIETIDYMDIEGYIWEKQKINRNFKKADFSDAVFKKFISNIGGSDDDRIRSIESTAGYLLHSHKPASYSPAVIINDEVISDNPEGGTGKGIFVSSVGHLKKSVIIDGKAFSFTKAFPYQRVSADTQMLVFDDVSKNFDFEKLFSIITEGITLEKKNKDEIHIPFERSPKIVITTNYAIKGDGNSFERRKWELEFAQHYHKNHTPEHEFGHQLFTQWDDCEWNKFDNYMISNLQLYLNKGLMKSTFKNLRERGFIARTSMDFYDWARDGFNQRTKALSECPAQDLYNDFTEQNTDYGPRGKFTLPQKKFYQWIDMWGDFMYNTKPYTWRAANGKMIRFDVKHAEQVKLKV